MTRHAGPVAVPPLGEPRPQPVPEAHETTLPNGLRLVVVPRPGVPLIELRLRVPFAARTARGRRRAHRPRRRALRRRAARHERARPDRHRRAAAEPRRGAVGLHRPRPAAVRHDACCRRPRPRSSACSPSCSPTPPTPTTRSRASATGSPSGSRSPAPSRASSPATALAARRYGDHPYAIQLPDDRPRRGGRRRRAAQAAPGAGRCPPAAASSWSATSTRARPPTRSPTRWPAGRRPGTPSRRRRPRSSGAPGIAARRPARRGAVQRPARRSGARPHRPRPARRPAGQHGLRRVLLLAAGREHPRAARLHLQPAQLGRPPGGRLVVPGRGRRRHRGDRPGAAGDLVRARPDGADRR